MNNFEVLKQMNVNEMSDHYREFFSSILGRFNTYFTKVGMPNIPNFTPSKKFFKDWLLEESEQ